MKWVHDLKSGGKVPEPVATLKLLPGAGDPLEMVVGEPLKPYKPSIRLAIQILNDAGIHIEDVDVHMKPHELITATVTFNFFSAEEGVHSGKLVGRFLSACGVKKTDLDDDAL